MLRGLDLFSGIGGLAIALGPWVQPIAYCENNRFAAGVLLSRMQEGSIPLGPIADDVRTLRGSSFLHVVDIVYGGFPCQPYSSAARGRNKPDEVVEHFARLVGETACSYVFAENVSEKALSWLKCELERQGYTTRTDSNTAADVGAPFDGRRYWLFAEANRDGKPAITEHGEVAMLQTDAESIWKHAAAEDVRMDDGLPFRMDRIRAMGNAVVPLQAREAFKRLGGLT